MPGPTFLRGDVVSLRPVEDTDGSSDPSSPRSHAHEDDDLEFLRDGVNHPSVWRSMERATPTPLATLREEIKRMREDDGTVPFLVTTRQSRVGFVSLTELNDRWGNGAISYWIDPDERGEGYGAEAVDLAVGYAFDHLRYHKLLAHTVATNEASIALLESVGFRKEGHHRSEAFVDGEYRDLLAYGLLEEEWRDAAEGNAD